MGWAKARERTLSEGLVLMEEVFPPNVNELLYKLLAAALAAAWFDAGRVTDALALVDQAVNTGEGPGSGVYVPEIHRLQGVFLWSLGPLPRRLRARFVQHYRSRRSRAHSCSKVAPQSASGVTRTR